MFSSPPDPLDRLPVDAVRHLAHEMRGALHTILGHSELLAVEARDPNTRESADHIHASGAKLAAWVDDLVELLRLPAVAARGEARLDLHALLEGPGHTAGGRGVRVRIDEPEGEGDRIVVDQSVERIVGRVLETVVASAKVDVEVRREPYRTGDAAAVVWIAPVPEELSDAENGVLAIAARVFAARGGAIERRGERMQVRVPTGQPASG